MSRSRLIARLSGKRTLHVQANLCNRVAEMEVHRALGVVVVLLHILMGVAGSVGSPEDVALLGKLAHGEILGNVVVVLYRGHLAVVLNHSVPGVPGSIGEESEIFTVAGGPELCLAAIGPSGSILELTVVEHKAELLVSR